MAGSPPERAGGGKNCRNSHLRRANAGQPEAERSLRKRSRLDRIPAQKNKERNGQEAALPSLPESTEGDMRNGYLY